MIHGIVDSQIVPPAEGGFVDELEPPVWLPTNALIHLDWINLNYYWNGAEQVPTDGLGGDYNPADIDSNGLLCHLGDGVIDYGPPNGPTLQQAITAVGSLHTQLVDLMLAGCTVVVDLDVQAVGYLTYPEGEILWFMDDPDPDVANFLVTMKPDTSPRGLSLFYPADFFDSSNPNLMSTEGIQSLAFTLNAPVAGPLYRWGGSINGRAGQFSDEATSVSDDQPTWPAGGVRLFGIAEFVSSSFPGVGLEEVHVRRLTVFPPVTDSTDIQSYSLPYFLEAEVTATFANVSLLCHFNGSDGDTTTTDSSSNTHTVTLAAGAAIDDDITLRWANNVLRFPDTGAPTLTVPNNADFQFGSGPFAIEFSIRFDNETMGSPFQIGHLTGGQLQWSVEFSSVLFSGIGFAFYWSEDGTATESFELLTLNEFLHEDTWYDIKIERDAQSILRISINGVVKVTRSFQFTLHASTADLKAQWFSSGSGTNAWLEEFRITKGDWWYGPNGVEPMTEEFPDS